jgi:hypothetical protein
MIRSTLAAAVILVFATSAWCQQAQLELLVVANSADDAQAIKDAKAFCADHANSKIIAKCQKDGAPPPAPDVKYEITTFDDAKSVVTYRWIELGNHELQHLDLEPVAKLSPFSVIWHRTS